MGGCFQNSHCGSTKQNPDLYNSLPEVWSVYINCCPFPTKKRLRFPGQLSLRSFSFNKVKECFWLWNISEPQVFTYLWLSRGENTTCKISWTNLITNLSEHLLGLVPWGMNLGRTRHSGGSSSSSPPVPPCPAHHVNWDQKAIKGYGGRLVLALHHLSGMFRNEYNNTEIKPIKSQSSQKKPFLHPTCESLESNCKNPAPAPVGRQTTGGLHQEEVWPLRELAFTSGKPLSAAAGDQVRLTSVPQTPDTPPQLPRPTKPGQVFTVNSSGAPGPSPPLLLLWVLRDQSSKWAEALFAQNSGEHLKFPAWKEAERKSDLTYCWKNVKMTWPEYS